jgi:hypothetical protein
VADNPQAHTSDLVFKNSPINILAKFTSFLRHRFSTDKTPWRYLDNEADTGIFIDTELNIAKGTTNQSPAIVVTRGSVIHTRNVLADRDQNNVNELRTGGKYSYGAMETDIRLECIGQTYGEASILGDIVQSAISMTLPELTHAFTLRDIGPVVLSPVAPYPRDEHKFVTYVDFRITAEHRWYTIKASPVLRGASLAVSSASLASSDSADPGAETISGTTVMWPVNLPPGGSEGQVLTKLSDASYAVGWVTPEEFVMANDPVQTGDYVYTGYVKRILGSWYIYRRHVGTQDRSYSLGADNYTTAWNNRENLAYASWP